MQCTWSGIGKFFVLTPANQSSTVGGRSRRCTTSERQRIRDAIARYVDVGIRIRREILFPRIREKIKFYLRD